jgi:hypothetical protein
MFVGDKCNTNTSNQAYYGGDRTYDCPATAANKSPFTLNTAFTVREIEVFEITD